MAKTAIKKKKAAPKAKAKKPSSKKKGEGGILPLILIFSAFLGAAYLFIWQKDFIKEQIRKIAYRPPIYEAAGIPIPEGDYLHGVDVSRYQLDIDWELMQSMDIYGKPIHFIFIKATEGNYMVDKYFEKNWAGSGKYNFKRGAYHYYKPNSDPKEQAALFIKTIKLKKGDIAPVVDFEEVDFLKKKAILADLKIFIDALEDHYKVKPIIYTSFSIYRDYLKGKFDKYPLWIAHYYKEKLQLPENKKWHFWQHSDKGRVNGVKGDVDYNVFNGSVQDFNKLLIK